jgi:hypothetical protein
LKLFVPSSIRTFLYPHIVFTVVLTPSSVKLPKSFVAIDLSEKIAPDSSERRTAGGGSEKGKDKDNSNVDEPDRGRSEERKESIWIPIADDQGNIASSSLFALEERGDGVQPAGLPPTALDS